MKRKRILLSLALLSALAFPACDTGHPEVDIVLERDFTEVIQAINDANKSLSDKLGLIESAMSSGMLGNQSLLKMVQEALKSMGGTMEEKLAAILAAVQSGTTALETKLALIEAALQEGFTDSKAQQALLLQAIQSLGGTAEEKLAAIEEAVKTSTTSLETKLGLVEAALQNGFADSEQAQALLLEAIDAAGKTMEEKIAAIEEAVKSQTASLEAKLALVETAVKEGFADSGKQQELLQQAVAALQGTLKEKLAAIESAMQNDNTGLETKLDLISAALEQGIADQKTAIANMQTALETTIQGLDATLAANKTAIIDQLAALSGQLTTEELAKAFKDIADAIDSKAQSGAALLENLAQAVNDLAESLEQKIAIALVGDPSQTITVTKGESFALRVKVDPEDATLVKDKLQVQVVSGKLFYPLGTGSGTEPDHFIIKSLDADPAVPGQYNVTVSTNSIVAVWDESVLTLVYNYGKDNKTKAKYANTQAFPVTMMPRARDALVQNYYPNAAFRMRDTILINHNKEIVDTMGVVYCALGSTEFKTEDGKDSRTYTAENILRTKFVRPDKPDTASVFTVFNKGKHFVSFAPDTVGNKAWRAFKKKYANDHEFQEVSGKLALTDRWGATDSLDLSMKWYVAWSISYEIVDTVKVVLKPGDFDWTGKTYALKYQTLWPNILGPWGLDYETIKKCGLELEHANRGCGYNYKLMRLKMGDGPSSPILEVAGGVKPVKGDNYQALGRFRLRARPSDVDPDFRPTQCLYKYDVTRCVTHDDETN